MLVLTRVVGERIVIGGDIVLTVTAVRGDQVRLGIAAPRHVRIDRQEVRERRSAVAEADRVAEAPAEAGG